MIFNSLINLSIIGNVYPLSEYLISFKDGSSRPNSKLGNTENNGQYFLPVATLTTNLNFPLSDSFLANVAVQAFFSYLS